MTQLNRDLRRRIGEKLQQWVSDSFDLYDMAELSPQEAVSDVLCVLIWHTVSALRHTKVPEHEIANLIHKAMGEVP